MKILAVDDEKIALEGLISAIREVEPSAEIWGFRKVSQVLEFYSKQVCDVAFLDIQMRTMSGIELAKRLKLITPQVNIIFATGYGDYREDAFEMHVSGYLTKPITPDKIRTELDNLRYPPAIRQTKRVEIVTFGNFEIYVDRKPLRFKYDKTKELLAYLVDRKGAYCGNAEIMSILWEDECRASYLGNLKKDLADVLKESGCQNVINTGRGRIRIDEEKVSCDYFDWCEGKAAALNRYHGEYMAQYSWAEFTNAELYGHRF